MKIKVKTIAPFIDEKANNIERVVGDELIVTPDRLKEINGTVHGNLVEVIEEDEQDGKGLRSNGKTDERKTEDQA